MRVLFNIQGADGHFLPLVTLAEAVQAEEHDVMFVTTSSYTTPVERKGFDVLGVDLPPGTTIGTPARKAALLTMRGDERTRFTYGGFLEVSVTHARRIVDAAVAWRPDVMIRETTAWGAWLAGELVDVPVASFDYAPSPRGFLSNVLGDLFQAARTEIGLPADDGLESLDRWLTMLGAPPGWYPPEVFRPTTHLFRPPADPAGRDSLPLWFDRLPERPNVYVTLGTAFNDTPGVFQMIFEAVEDLEVNVIATVGRFVDPASFGVVPTNIYLERFIPQTLLLPHCAAMIAHGGYGSLMGAISHGVPVVTIPLAAADNDLSATRIESLGTGIAVQEDDRSVQSIRAAVIAILRQPGYRAAAQNVAAQTADLPPLENAVQLIERLARARQPILAS